ncbi:DUF6241 domain-containing protein [Oceanobacillus picturae]|uniref:DUF6241 domain-containing protein n=1 Tax=Oceanobacillus picturae TaxID=171693 RepID=UPI00362ABDF7
MKKLMIWSIISIVAVAAIWIGFSLLWNWIGDKPVAEDADKQSVTVSRKQDPINNKVENQEDLTELDKVLSEIDEGTLKLDIDENTDQIKIMDIMHQMTHQKVKAQKKWGYIPMHPKTVSQVYNVVKDSNFERKTDLMDILEDWKSGDFSHVDRDHNFFWESQEGTVGKAYGLQTLPGEIQLIKQNFLKE